jgi:hypothetical protein
MTSDIRFDNFDDDEDDLDEGDALALTNTVRVFSVKALIAAWQDDGPDNLYYIDTESGAVILVNPNLFNLKDTNIAISTYQNQLLINSKKIFEISRKQSTTKSSGRFSIWPSKVRTYCLHSTKY